MTGVAKNRAHYAALDGWRGISIVLVLAGHMLPLGPKAWRMNETIAATGMAIFFILSGFLIATTLLRDDRPVPFLIRRWFRILPLAWLFVLLFVAAWCGAPRDVVLANLLFYANSSEHYLTYAGHLWSLSVEMQFYVAVAGLVAIAGRRGLLLLPVLALLVTAHRVAAGETMSIQTLGRVDEILAGASLALLFHHRGADLPAGRHGGMAAVALGLLLVASAHPWVARHLAPLAYLRPYIAAATIGATLVAHGRIAQALSDRRLAYLAKISYALYVLHPITYSGWLGSGDAATRYAKRILSFLLTGVLAHGSTFWFERPLTRLGHDLARRCEAWPRRATGLRAGVPAVVES